MLDISVPGFTRDELEIMVKGNALIVRGTKPHHVEKTGVEYIVEEFSMDAFERKFKLSDELIAEHIEAKCENGVLHISFSDETTAADKKPHHVNIN